MRGNINIVNTPADLAVSQMTREQIIAAATITVRTDKAAYPDGYDRSLNPADSGYIEPDYQYDDVIDPVALVRFGVTL